MMMTMRMMMIVHILSVTYRRDNTAINKNMLLHRCRSFSPELLAFVCTEYLTWPCRGYSSDARAVELFCSLDAPTFFPIHKISTFGPNFYALHLEPHSSNRGRNPYKPNKPCEQPTFCSEHNIQYIANTASGYKPYIQCYTFTLPDDPTKMWTCQS